MNLKGNRETIVWNIFQLDSLKYVTPLFLKQSISNERSRKLICKRG